MLRETYPYYLANRAAVPNHALEVTDKYTGKVATRVALANPAAIERAIAAAVEAASAMARLPHWKRQAILLRCVAEFEARREELAEALCVEAGKPIRDSRGEVGRLIDTFRIAAEEAVRIGGEVLPLDISARAEGYRGMWKRVPVGPCSFISPFNFPLNLAAHKIAPAIAAGCPFVLKPASRTPVGALLIGEILAETELPAGAFSILPCAREHADPFVEDDRLKLLSFTGSDEVGWELKRRAGKKKILLELGGNAACIVDEDVDLEDAVGRVIVGAFYQTGQSCISVQRLIVHEQVYDAFRDRLVAETRKLKVGNPLDEETFIGPVISEAAAERIEQWIREAERAGGRILCGGRREGVMVEPTLMENVPRDQKLVTQEAFGPVAVLSCFSKFEEALREANDTRFGLQAGVFTRDLYRAQRAWDELQVGGVVIGDVPSWRVDHMPYGGVKDSGLGREGIRNSIEAMTEIRLLVIRTPPGEGGS
ncbi:MAG TPA: aldehyde dehydrogenase family protein [Candidatus Sumerlaeota bacterium]|nr:aldehyde dehydrogenase family protein [Candidatus Sumerlaeota bacterium]